MASDTASTIQAKKPPSLFFDRNSLINAKVYQAGSPVYTIITNKSGSRTDVCDTTGQSIVATIKRRGILSDTVQFPSRNEGKAVAINKWLRKITLPHFLEECTSLVTDLGSFVWKTDRNYRLGLFSEDDPSTALAHLLRTGPSDPLILHLQEGSEEMIEDILVSFIILEQKLRLAEKRRLNGMMYGPISQDGLS